MMQGLGVGVVALLLLLTKDWQHSPGHLLLRRRPGAGEEASVPVDLRC